MSDPWTGFTQFTLLEEKPPEIYVVRRSFMARNLEDNGKECQVEGEAKVVE